VPGDPRTSRLAAVDHPGVAARTRTSIAIDGQTVRE
jgi:hypothetical protein